jgi:nitrous oxide reductase
METKNMMIAVAVLLVVIGGGYFAMSRNAASPEQNIPETAVQPTTQENQENTAAVAPATAEPTTAVSAVKEFAMNSWMETVDGKMSAHFSLKEIVVKKGDKVRITITNTAGDHDFTIDAYNIKTETPLDKPTVVEFTADKAGTFEYYCSKYSHRMIGQTGTLRVTE